MRPRPYDVRMPSDPERPWQYELLDKLPPSLDESQLDENLKLTPTERLEKMLKMLRFLRGARDGGVSGLSGSR